MESAEMISALNSSAKSRLSSVLPTAVGPMSTRIFCFSTSSLLQAAEASEKLFRFQAHNDGASMGTGKGVFRLGQSVHKCPHLPILQVLSGFDRTFARQSDQGFFLAARGFPGVLRDLQNLFLPASSAVGEEAGHGPQDEAAASERFQFHPELGQKLQRLCHQERLAGGKLEVQGQDLLHLDG